MLFILQANNLVLICLPVKLYLVGFFGQPLDQGINFA
jgi:hypothetical protein